MTTAFVLLPAGSVGNVSPFVAIGRGLKERGYDVTLLTHCFYEQLIISAGLTFGAIDSPAEFESFMADGPQLNMLRTVPNFFRHHVLPRIIREYNLIRAHCRTQNTVLVARWTPGIAARFVAESLNLPLISVFEEPSNAATLPIIEQLTGPMFGVDLNHIRTNIGLPPIVDWYSFWRSSTQYIGLWPEWFAERETAWPSNVHLTGFVWNDDLNTDEIPRDLRHIFEEDKPSILITGGTGLFAGQKFFAVSTEACHSLGYASLLVTRHRNLLPAQLPSSVTWTPHVPSLAKLMPHASVIVHHGGLSSSGQALAAGVAQMVLADGGNRLDNGFRLQRLGVAESIPLFNSHVESVMTAVRHLTSSGAVHAQCRALAQRMHDDSAVDNACDALERLLPISTLMQELPTMVHDDANFGSEVARVLADRGSNGLLGQRLSQLSSDKMALLERRLGQKRLVSGTTIPPLPRINGTNVFPVSFAQEQLWLLDQLEGESPAYNAPAALHLIGPLKVAALQRSLNEILRRHEVLQTAFTVMDGQPMQVIVPGAAVDLPIIDIGNRSFSTDDESAVLGLACEQAQRSFDLSQGPLLRASLLRIDQENHILFLVIHHIVADGWSIGVLVQELSALYSAFATNKSSPLPDPPIQYADFAVWQRQRMQGELLEKHLSYWREQLLNAPATLNLPTNRRPTVRTYQGLRQPLALSLPLTNSLKTLGRHEGATFFITLFAAFATLLSRYAGQYDIVVGSPITNRHYVELRRLIGHFVNMIALRIDLSGDPTFFEVLRRARSVALDAYAHQELPFELIVQSLPRRHDESRSPLFQVMFALQNEATPVVSLPELTVNPLQIHNNTAKYDITLAMEDTGRGLIGTVEYNADIFDKDMITRFIGHFEVLLNGIVAHPERVLSKLPILSDAEHREVMSTWNDTARDYPFDACLHDLFEAQVRQTPDTIAAIYRDRQITYAELNCRADQLAHQLHVCGSGPETLIGLCVARSLEMLVGIIGILKTGAAYVPLDPAYPTERLAFMLEDAQVSVLVTQSRFADCVPIRNMQVFLLDEDQTTSSSSIVESLRSDVVPENLAYVLYTSGSTGIPKGVLGCHRGTLNRAYWMWDAYPFSEGEVCCQKTALSFVDSVWEIFGPLLRGISSIIIPDEDVRDIYRLVHVLAEHRVTRIVIVPSLLRTLLDAVVDLAEQLPLLTLWCVSGEALPLDLLQQFRKRLPQSKLVNLYGSSEIAGDVTWWDTQQAQEAMLVPVGRPISNTQIYVLDHRLQAVPVGVTGDVYVGGAGLARGYQRRADLTAMSFIPSPFASTPGERLYRTGDLARYRADGILEYLGRMDDQVKVRGFRIEIGEIETALRNHPLVRDATVLAQDDVPGHTRLVAYVVAASSSMNQAGIEQGSQLDIDTGGEVDWRQPIEGGLIHEYRESLRIALPEYMIPASFVLLDELPLLPNGKVDRHTLAALVATPLEYARAYVAPRTAIEEGIGLIWAKLLHLKRVGVHENFFDLGGHSLLAVQLVAEIQATFQIHLPLRAVFVDATVAKLAASVDKAQRAAERMVADDSQLLQESLENLSDAQIDALLLDPLISVTVDQGADGNDGGSY